MGDPGVDPQGQSRRRACLLTPSSGSPPPLSSWKRLCKVTHGDELQKRTPDKARMLMKVSDLVSPRVPLATGQVSAHLGAGALCRRPEGRPAQVRHDFSFLALRPCWAGGQQRSGTPGSRRSCRGCSGFGQHSDTCSNRTCGTYRSLLSSRGLSQKGGLLG